MKQRKLAQWYYCQTKVKQISQKNFKGLGIQPIWRNLVQSAKTKNKAISSARANYYSSLIKKNNNFFSTVARVTALSCIILVLNSNDFMSFFNDKNPTIRVRIHHFLPRLWSTNLSSNTGTLDTAVRPEIYLDCFLLSTFNN